MYTFATPKTGQHPPRISMKPQVRPQVSLKLLVLIATLTLPISQLNAQLNNTHTRIATDSVMPHEKLSDTVTRVVQDTVTHNAQLNDTLTSRSTDTVAFDARQKRSQAADSTLAPPQIDSTFFADPAIFARTPTQDTIRRINHWVFNPSTWWYEQTPVDSSFREVSFHDPALPRYSYTSTLGLSYAPTHRDEFFTRPTMHHTSLLSDMAIMPYLATPHIAYHTQGPHSHFKASMDTKTNRGELSGSWLYTQNISPEINIGFQLLHGDEKSSIKFFNSRLNGGQVFTSYAKQKLFASFSGSYKKLTLNDNGGIEDPFWLLDTVVKSEQFPTNLTKAKAVYTAINATLDLTYDLYQRHFAHLDSTGIKYVYREPALSLISLHSLSRNTRKYTDDALPEAEMPYLISNSATSDSTATLRYQGRMGIQYKHSPHSSIPLPSLRAWIGYALEQCTSPKRQAYIIRPTPTSMHSLHIGGTVHYDIRHVELLAAVSSHFLGEQIGNTTLNTRLNYYPTKRKERIALNTEFQFQVAKPNHYISSFFSNTATWDNTHTFKPTITLDLNVTLQAPAWGGEYGVRARQYKNYTYFDLNALPAQQDNLTVLATYVQQEFNRWGLTSLARILFQQTSHREILLLPVLSAYATIGYQYELIKNVFTLHLAVEAYYRTAFLADKYNSPLGIFHNQNEIMVGNYPLMNVALNIKWKQVNLFIKVNHASQDLFGRNYFASALYPEKDRTVRLGLQWFFYK